jgi:hypothetical protein
LISPHTSHQRKHEAHTQNHKSFLYFFPLPFQGYLHKSFTCRSLFVLVYNITLQHTTCYYNYSLRLPLTSHFSCSLLAKVYPSYSSAFMDFGMLRKKVGVHGTGIKVHIEHHNSPHPVITASSDSLAICISSGAIISPPTVQQNQYPNQDSPSTCFSEKSSNFTIDTLTVLLPLTLYNRLCTRIMSIRDCSQVHFFSILVASIKR